MKPYLYFAVMTVSDATLLPTVFAPDSRAVHTAETPGDRTCWNKAYD